MPSPISTDSLEQDLLQIWPYILEHPQKEFPLQRVAHHMRSAYVYLSPSLDSPSYLQYGAEPDPRVSSLLKDVRRTPALLSPPPVPQPRFRVDPGEGEDELDEILCCVAVPGSHELVAVFSYEHVDDATEPHWLFLTLYHTDATTSYSDTVEEALQRAKSMHFSRPSRPKELNLPQPKAEKTPENMAQGEGTTPGAYGEASDFWDGWSDNDDESVTSLPTTDVTPNDYWAQYDSVQSVIGEEEEHEEQSKPPSIATRSRRSSTIRPSPSQMALHSSSQKMLSTPTSPHSQHVKLCLKGLFQLHLSSQSSLSREQSKSEFQRLVDEVMVDSKESL